MNRQSRTALCDTVCFYRKIQCEWLARLMGGALPNAVVRPRAPLAMWSALAQRCAAVVAIAVVIVRVNAVPSFEPVDQRCTSAGSLLGLCQAGFSLGCESTCVEKGGFHESLRCRILNRKYTDHSEDGFSVDPPWLAVCPCRASHVGNFTETVFAMDKVVASPNGGFVFTIGQNPSSLGVVDIATDISTPSVIARLLLDVTYPADIAVSNDGNYVFVVDSYTSSLLVVNVTDPTQPMVVGFLQDTTKMGFPKAVAVSPEGGSVFVTGFMTNTVAMVDVSDPTNPRLSASVGGRDQDQPNAPTQIAISPSADALFVMTSASSFQVVRLHSSGTNKLQLGGRLAGNAAELSIADVDAWQNETFAFTTDSSTSTLSAMDVSNPSSPVLAKKILGNATFMFLPSAVTTSINGRFLYVTDSLGTLTIIRVNIEQQELTLSVNDVFPVLQGQAKHLAQSPDGQYVYVLGVTVDGNRSSFHVVKVCDS